MPKTNKVNTAVRNIIIEWKAKIITKQTTWAGNYLSVVHGKMQLLPSLTVRHGPYLDEDKDFSLDVYYLMSATKSAASAYYLISKNIGDVVTISGLIGNRIVRDVKYMPELTGFVNIDIVKAPPAWLNKTTDYLHSQFLTNNNMMTPVERMRTRRQTIGFTNSPRGSWGSPANTHSIYNGTLFDSCNQYDYAREIAYIDCSAIEELESMF